MSKFYAVRIGRIPGIYLTWDECQLQTNKFPGSQFKSFPSRAEAEQFIAGVAAKPALVEANLKPYLLRFDGGAVPNPGKAGCGAVLYQLQEGKYVEVAVEMVHFDHATNNFAEYNGLILGLQLVLAQQVNDLQVEGDSMLVISQMNGDWRVDHQNIIPLHARAKQLAAQIKNIQFRHIPRAQNSRADQLANQAILM